MSTGIEFDEDNVNKYTNISHGLNNNFGSGNEEKGMTGWLIRHNLAKSPEGAQKYLYGIIAVNLIIIIVALSYMFL